MLRRQLTRIPKFFLLLLLGTQKASAYAPSTKRGFRDLRIRRTDPAQQPSYTIGTNSYDSPHQWHNGFRIRLASSFSSDDDHHEDIDPSTTIGLPDDSSHIQKSCENEEKNSSSGPSILKRMFDEIPFIHLFFSEGRKKLPPVQVDDFGVMLYDIFLIVNLSLSISFWVTHRLDFTFIPYAFNEGCLFAILWIASGMYHGSFLHSAMDGHYPVDDEQGRGGPKAAAALAFNTYINTINLRLVSALIGAWFQHRKVFEGSPMEELIPLEIACGLVLMTFWRALHSQVTPRVR